MDLLAALPQVGSLSDPIPYISRAPPNPMELADLRNAHQQLTLRLGNAQDYL
ncbi:MAG: hypothetical protein HC924_00095 [Synechococcaceae cyanobacterium SM2_3_2]|nr:hypothetical protein [Synechococcaceae cyanobacterium SM2_3_2]